MATKAAEGVGDGQIAVTEDELRELNYNVSALCLYRFLHCFSKKAPSWFSINSNRQRVFFRLEKNLEPLASAVKRQALHRLGARACP